MALPPRLTAPARAIPPPISSRRLQNTPSGVAWLSGISQPRRRLMNMARLLDWTRGCPARRSRATQTLARSGSRRRLGARAPAQHLVAQRPPQDLADRRLRQAVAELDMPRDLVAGQVGAGMGADLLDRDPWVFPHDIGRDRLARVLVRNPDHRGLEHARMADEHV